jgi:heme-degrading monooxygenase HmoA
LAGGSTAASGGLSRGNSAGRRKLDSAAGVIKTHGRGVLMSNFNDVYVRIWEFQAQPGKENEFENVYGPDGEWVKLFQKSKYFVRTELYRDIENDGRYVTVDYFASQAGFQAFLKEFRDAYDALDRRCEAVCASEKRMGSFSSVGQLKLQ